MNIFKKKLNYYEFKKAEEEPVALRALNLLNKTLLYHHPSKPKIKSINLYLEVNKKAFIQ